MKNRPVLLTGMLVFVLVLVTACGTAGTPPYEATAAAVDAQNQADAIIADAEATATAIVAAAGNGEVAEDVVAEEATEEPEVVEEATEEPEVVEEATEEPEVVEEATEEPEPADLVDIAATTEGFSTLVAAVQAAGLEDTLRDGEFTVFAPTDEAFVTALDALGLTAEELLADTETLTSILLYHVVEGTITSDMLEDGDVATVNGAPVTISLEDGVMVNDATVITADVEASNGVIHVINAVLLPPVEEVEAEPTEEPEMAEEVSSEESLLMTLVDLADAERGEELFAEMKEVGFACSTCHLVDAETQLIGPGLLNIYDNAGERVEGEGAYEYIYNSIRNSQVFIVEGFAAGLMPVYTEEILPDEDIYHIMAYLLTVGE